MSDVVKSVCKSDISALMCECSSHRCLSMGVGQYAVNSDLVFVLVVHIHPQVCNLSVCWTKTVPSVVPLGVLLSERGHSLDKFPEYISHGEVV